MKNKTKKIIIGLGFFVLAGLATSCNSFCSDQDISSYLYGYDPLNINLFDSREDALKYANLFVPEGYNKFTLNTKILDHNGNEISLISEEKFGDFNLYYIHSAKITVKPTDTSNDELILYFGKNDFVLDSVEAGAISELIYTPYNIFYEELDKKVLNNIYSKAVAVKDEYYSKIEKDKLTFQDIYGYSFSDLIEYRTNEDKDLLKVMLEGDGVRVGRNNSIITKYGYSKYSNSIDPQDYFANLKTWNNQILNEYGPEVAMNADFYNKYTTLLSAKIKSLKTCISITDNGVYGHISNDPLNETVPVTNKAEAGFWKSWGPAFKEHGFLEGLFVYPVSYAVEDLSHKLGMNGWGQVGAIIIVTIVIRVLMAGVMLPQTIQQQKMTFLQPELTKLQQKYPNANTNQYEKQRLAQAQMALYKKNNIHPFLTILLTFVQLPIFLCVWHALSGSASLTSDSVLGLYLSDTILNTLKNVAGWPKIPGWWTALVLFLLMSAGQVFAVLLPQLINKKRQKKVAKMNVSQSQKSQDSQGKLMSYGLTALIIILGITLPSAMGVYWFTGAIFSVLQTLITQLIIKKKEAK